VRQRSGLVFNRKAVEEALTKASGLWNQLDRKHFPNCVIIFCSEETSEVFHPPVALHRHLYSCGKTFNTSLLREWLANESRPSYGIVVIDSSKATLGSAQGLSSVNVKQFEHLKSSVHGKTRRGGQSQNRYQRTHENEKLEFARKVAERVHAKLSDVHNLVIAGPGDMKDALKDALTEDLRKRLLCEPFSISCNAGPQGLNQAAMRASHAAQSHERKEADTLVQTFFEKNECAPDAVCYGEEQTLRALEMGAVDSLLIAEGFESADGLTFKALAALAEGFGTSCFQILSCAADSVSFCSGYRIAGILRYALDDLLDEPEDQELEPAQESEESCESTQLSESEQRHKEDNANKLSEESWETTALTWLTTNLSAELNGSRPDNGPIINGSDAMALTECVALLFEDESMSMVEGLHEAVDILLNDGVSLEFVQEFEQVCVALHRQPGSFYP